jgi:hypothetical protein
MRIAAAGILVFAGLVIAVLVGTVRPDAAFAAPRSGSSPVSGSSQLVTLVTALGENRQQLLVIDPELHVMSVYHVDSGGEVTLKSVRNFHWDLQMEQFNGTNPLPREIRSLMQQR